jgi:adenylate kinase
VAARLIVLGRQGAGKGTQCTLLAAHLGVDHISTGDLFRAEIAAGTTVGRDLDRYVTAGELVPDELVLDVVARRLGGTAARSRGYVLDGFPRTLAQGQALFEVLGADAADLAVEIEAPTALVVPRLAARRVCNGCGAISTAPDCDAAPSTCVDCGGEVARRADDHPDAIERRLALYETAAAPLLVWLDSQGILVTVDGVGDPDIVQGRIVEAVAARVPGLRASTS